MSYPSLQHPGPLPLQQSTADPDLHRRHSNTVCLSLCGVFGSWCAQGLFEPSEYLWQVQGLTLNKISRLLLSCWGFSFAFGHGLSPQSCSSTAQPPLQHCADELRDDAVKILKDDAVKVLHSICQQI